MMYWNWPALLGRSLPQLDALAHAAAPLYGRRVLITGAGGSIGTALTEAVLRGAPDSVILVERSEYALYELDRRVRSWRLPETTVVPLLGDILEPAWLSETLARDRPDVVFHLAAYKHVSLLEQNAYAAMANNAVGTMRLLNELAGYGEAQLILLSTDKAVQPASRMGTSKRIAELALLAYAGTPGDAYVQGSVLRLANVLESSGSIVPLFAEQLREGAPLTITHPSASRTFITSAEAALALLHAAAAERPGKVLVPITGRQITVVELAEHMIGRHAAASGCSSNRTSQMKIVGLRPGEKLVETMTCPHEVHLETLPSGMRVYSSSCLEASTVFQLLGRLEQAVTRRDGLALQAALRELLPAAVSHSESSL